MSSSSGSTEGSVNADELLDRRARFEELANEKEKLRDSKSESLKLIRSLEIHVKILSDAHEEDKKHREELERELSNCCQEIDYLRDQLNMRNLDLTCVEDQVCSLQLKLADMENLEEEVERLREQIKIFESERSLLIQEIEDKEVEIRYSASRTESLEESFSSMGLEYQCEIESTKLESIALEQNLLEMKKMLEKSCQENLRLNELIQGLELRMRDTDKVIESLDKENKKLKEQLKSDMNAKAFMVEEQFHDCLEINGNQYLNKPENGTSSYGNLLRPLISKFSIPRASDSDLRNKIAKMTLQIDEYEHLVKELKEELRSEKLKAKEEAEDLTQEMAELRYQLTSMLEEECKRRANVEQISLQRITELEAQLSKERQKSVTPQDLVVRNW